MSARVLAGWITAEELVPDGEDESAGGLYRGLGGRLSRDYENTREGAGFGAKAVVSLTGVDADEGLVEKTGHRLCAATLAELARTS